MQEQSRIDTMPVDVDKKAFNLRLREKEKELAHSKFRIKSFSTVDRLNNMYEDTMKFPDSEMFRNKGPKKIKTMSQATKKYHEIQL